MEGVSRQQLTAYLEEINNNLAVVGARMEAENEAEQMAQVEEAIAERKKQMQEKQEEW
jgi:alkyl hydroperoxide reductase subunit AhpF